MSENDFSGESSQKFISSLWLAKKLVFLDMSKWKLFGDAFLTLWEGLYRNQTIETLILQDNQLTDEHPEQIAKLFTSYMNTIR